MGYCMVCKEGSDTNGHFRLPKFEAKRKLWIEQLKLDANILNHTQKDFRVCFRHFKDSDYRIFGKQMRLKPGKVLTMVYYCIGGSERRPIRVSGEIF